MYATIQLLRECISYDLSCVKRLASVLSERHCRMSGNVIQIFKRDRLSLVRAKKVSDNASDLQ